MTDETTEQIPPTGETLEQPTLADVLKAIAAVNKRLDGQDLQLEAIRTGIVANSADFDRLTAKVLNLSADVKELTEEVRKSSIKTLI